MIEDTQNMNRKIIPYFFYIFYDFMVIQNMSIPMCIFILFTASILLRVKSSSFVSHSIIISNAMHN